MPFLYPLRVFGRRLIFLCIALSPSGTSEHHSLRKADLSDIHVGSRCVHYALFEDEFYLKARWRKAKYPAAWTSGRYVVNAYVSRNCRSTSAS